MLPPQLISYTGRALRTGLSSTDFRPAICAGCFFSPHVDAAPHSRMFRWQNGRLPGFCLACVTVVLLVPSGAIEIAEFEARRLRAFFCAATHHPASTRCQLSPPRESAPHRVDALRARSQCPQRRCHPAQAPQPSPRQPLDSACRRYRRAPRRPPHHRSRASDTADRSNAGAS